MRLRIESVGGSPVNEYVIRDGQVAVRSLAPSGHAFPDAASDWRILDQNDIRLHHALGTVVSKWLRVRLAEHTPTLRKAA